MENLELTVNIKVDLSESTKSFLENLSKGIFRESLDAPKPQAPQHETPKPQAPQHDAPKPQAPQHETPKPQAPQHDAPKPQAPQHDAPTDWSPTIEDCREAMRPVINEFRPQIAQEMHALGAKKLSEMDESKFNEFYTFLISLKK